MVLSVASGKGGSGKTFFSTNLAFSISRRREVQLLDCDVEEPNDHIFLKPSFYKEEPVYLKYPEIDEEKCTHCGKCAELCEFKALAVLPTKVLLFEHLCHGCGVCSYFCPENAITEKDRKIGAIKIGKTGKIDFIQGELMVGEATPHPVIKQVKTHIDNKKIAIVDSSPGTSCPVVEAIKDSNFCVLVTEPTPFGFNDFKLAVDMVNDLKVKAGVVINRVIIDEYSQISNISEEKKIRIEFEKLYDKKNIGEQKSTTNDAALKYYDVLKNYCKGNNLPILMEIPINML